MTRVTASNPFPCNPHIPLLLKGLPQLPWPLNPVQTAEVGMEDLSPSGSSPFALSVPSHPHFLTITLDGLSGPISEASLALGLCNSLFLQLLSFFASFFKARLNASSSRKPSWIHPLGSSPGLNMHNTRAEPPHGSTSCGSVLVASRKVRKGLSSLPVSLMLPDGVSHLRTEIFV